MQIIALFSSLCEEGCVYVVRDDIPEDDETILHVPAD